MAHNDRINPTIERGAFVDKAADLCAKKISEAPEDTSPMLMLLMTLLFADFTSDLEHYLFD